MSSDEDDWVVRQVTGSAATRAYRCPGCDHEIRPGDAARGGLAGRADHEAGLADRRHWHTACWRARGRRGPKTQRSRNAPRY